MEENELIPVDNNNAVEYTDDNIRHLSDMEHVRTRPGMYIGRLGDGAHAEAGMETHAIGYHSSTDARAFAIRYPGIYQNSTCREDSQQRVDGSLFGASGISCHYGGSYHES